MDGTDWPQIAEVFDRLEPLDDAARRAGLERLPPAVASRVSAMLEGAAAKGILDCDPLPVLGDPLPRTSMAPGDRVGPFAIEKLIGRGGMGEVYLAKRVEASFDQHVAIKLLRVDAVSSEAAFARERRMLAKLDHPGIARLIDGGITPEGRPWTAMAYVEGLPIDQWCAQHKASLGERLRLVQQVCEAVAYAHANLIVHRDIKPSNIVVDARGCPILLDFGIAKLIEEGVETLPPDAAMTPGYAAPEQLESQSPTVATDIHALGLILYELLTATTPWHSNGSALSVLVRRVMQEEPLAPSRMAARTGIGLSPDRLRGDLDAIVLKALRKVPADRYATVREFADDLNRYESGRPVIARAGSRRYRWGKYLSRNRWYVGAAAVVFAATVIGSLGIALQARKAAAEREIALAEARRSDSIVQTLTLMFAQGGHSEDLTLKQALDESSLRLLATLDGSARSGATIGAVSDLYGNMGDAQGSYDLLSAALERGIGKRDPATTARMEVNLADAAVVIGKSDDAEKLLGRAEAVFRREPARFAAELQNAVTTRAAIARRKRDYATAIALLQDSLPEAERVWAANDSALLTRYNNLVVYMIEAGRMDDVAPLYARLDRLMTVPGRRDTIQAIGLEALRGAWQLRRGDTAGAEVSTRAAVNRRRRLFGDTAGLANDLLQLGKVQLTLGKPAEARVALIEARPMMQRYLGASSMPGKMLDLTLAQAHAETGDAAAARALLAQVRQLIAAMPVPNPLAPQLDLTEAVVALASRDLVAASGAAARARATFAAMGPAGSFGLASAAKLEARIAQLR